MDEETFEHLHDPAKFGAEESPQALNRLALSQSPYLLQHAANPVDWYTWGPEAFNRAKEEDKPVFLSIGYSTCHWCHVMAHESFEDPEAAALLNDAVVCVKVDREERPDIDGIYMTVCQLMTGQGGWPLTIIMTPDKKPFFSATYLPKESRFGRIGLKELIPRVKQVWQSRRQEVLDSAETVLTALRQAAAPQQRPKAGPAPAGWPILDRALEELRKRFDPRHGGFGNAPKFPSAHTLMLLLRLWKRTGDEQALVMVEKTLESMRQGGLFDQVGFGFHRYSTDAEWLLPHFEKMLYDQAMLSLAYIEGYEATAKPIYAQTARQVLTYLLRDLRAPEGAFYSAEDADSEGAEGRFYIWSKEEIDALLGPEEAAFAARVWNIRAGGNFNDEATGQPSGANILHLSRPLPGLAAELGLSDEELERRLVSVRKKLEAGRAKRVRPHLDNKVLTDWNGLIIAALARAAQALGEPQYARAAKKAAQFILATLHKPYGRLLHRYRSGQAAVPAYVDDYAFFIWGLIELYEATFESGFLETALDLNREMIEHFWDNENGGFFFTADDAENLLVRRKEVTDGAYPSGNSVAMLNLLRLARLTGQPELEAKAAELAATFAQQASQAPSAHAFLLTAFDFARGPSFEVVIAGDPKKAETQALLEALRTVYLPNKVVLLNPSGKKSPRIHSLAPFIKDFESPGGEARAYVCHNFSCGLPTSDPVQMLRMLQTRPVV